MISVVILFYFVSDVNGQQDSTENAQQDSIVDQIFAVLILDSLTITADNQVPDVKSMIRQTINDTTFYRAFQRLRRTSYSFSSELYFYNPEWIPYTYFRSSRVQHVVNGMRTNEILDEFAARHMKDRKGNYEFYTARMYDRIFFTDTPTRVPNQWTDDVDHTKQADSRMEKYIHDLKLLLFAPGTEIGLPLMGDKTAIFTEKQMKNYRYSLTLDSIINGVPVYVFMISAEPEIPERQTIVKEMRTVFNQQNKQILSRSYRLAYQTLLYSFDVTMDIEIEQHESGYIPMLIAYQGQWKVPLKKPELCNFTFRITEFL